LQLQLGNFSEHEIAFIFSPMRNCLLCCCDSHKKSQNDLDDLVCAPVATNSAMSVHIGITFKQVRDVSSAVSKLGCTDVVFLEPGTEINRQYYREVLPMQCKNYCP